MPLYHHCRSLDSVVFGEVRPDPKYADPDFKDAYLWLEKEVGFYPLFLAVGASEESIRMTGYQNQWRRLLVEGQNHKEYRPRGEFPNDVLFSFKEVKGVFMDYDFWHIVLNSTYRNYQLTSREKRLIFKPSYLRSAWLRKARNSPHTVQLVAPSLHLPSAERVCVRNKETMKKLFSLGFRNVCVKRLRIEG